MTNNNTVKRGYVLIHSGEKLSAVVTGPEAERLKRRVGGRRVSAVGLRFRKAQGTLRVIIDADRADALNRPTA